MSYKNEHHPSCAMIKSVVRLDCDCDCAVGELEKLHAVIQNLLQLDAKRPIDPVHWYKWWNAAKDRARSLLPKEQDSK